MASSEYSIPSFPVRDVRLGSPLEHKDPSNLDEQWKHYKQNARIEAKSPAPENAVFYFRDNALVTMVHQAFYKHYPLEISPDVIWTTISQGFAKHIDLHHKELRNKFVNFEGKKKICVNRPNFVKGSPDNDWEGVFPEFAEQIGEYIGEENLNLLTNDFSSTTPTDRICGQITLMSAMKNFFEYEMMCGCGIPSIQLTGTVEDWQQLREKAEMLNDGFLLEWWCEELFPVLDEFVKAAQGNPDVAFWTSINNLYGGSGWRRPVTGWVQVFFPYLTDGKNTRLGVWRKCYESGSQNDLEEGGFWNSKKIGEGCGYGVSMKYFPSSICSAPVKYTDPTGTYDYHFCAGLTCVVQNPETLALSCKTGWCVLDAGKIRKTKNKK